MSPDIDGAKKFYSGVFGWDLEDQFDDDGNHVYVMARQNGRAVAGMGSMPPGAAGMPSVWNTYITSDNLEASVEAVTSAGGSVMMPPMQVMTSGRMAVCADPTGAAFSMWEPGEHIGAEVGNIANTHSWNELMTRDIDAAKAFYTKVFGWSYEVNEMPDGPYNVIAGGESGGLGGLMSMPAEVPDMVPNHWVVYFSVADIAASIALVTDHGGQVMMEPMTAPGVGTFATVLDTAGAAFSVMQPEDA
jgi:predicted enzyme related to lactoylglutathione lyase